jgi:uncharacterized protein (DUF2147 family)
MKRQFFFRALPSLAFVLGALNLGSIAQAADTNDPHGLWLRPEGGVRFSFYDCEGLLCAKVVGADNPRDRSGIGAVILRGARKTAANEWRGPLFNLENGKTYDGYITVNAGELTVKGCIMGLLCGGETWKRIPAPVSATSRPRPMVAVEN